jgi:hypothetical protein
MAMGDVRSGVDDHHIQTRNRQDLGDAAAHVTRADHGDLVNLGSHAAHNLSSVRPAKSNYRSWSR